MIENSFWKDKRVLITGHTGFKGSWLLLWLITLGAKVYCYSLKPYEERNLYLNLFKNNNNFQFEEKFADIRDEESLSKWINYSQPEIVFHLAAQPLVRESYLEPLYTWDVNLIGSYKLLECLKILENKCSILVVTTDKVYLNREQIYNYKEDDELGGSDPYSASKAALEIAISSWRESFCGNQYHQNGALRIATARSGNVIGGGDWSKDRIIPDIVSSLLDQRTILVRNPLSTRPWQHVLEPLNGYLKLAMYLYNANDAKCEAYNFGPSLQNNKSVKDLVEEVIKSWPGTWTKDHEVESFHESKLLSLDSNKSYKILNWEQKWNFQQTVFNTVEWYQKVYQEKTSPLEACLNNLINFQKI